MEAAKRTELLLVYGIERQDNQNNQVVMFAIIAAALAYLVASAAFLLANYSHGSYKHVPSVVLLVSPVIPLALLSSLVVRMSTSVIRLKHLKKIETLLTGTPAQGEFVLPDGIPSGIRDVSYQWEFQGWLSIYTTLGFVASFGIFVVTFGYICAILIPGPWPTLKGVIFGIYCFAIAVQILGVLIPGFEPKFKTTFIT